MLSTAEKGNLVLDKFAIFLSLISAGLWFWSASLKQVIPMGYLSGPPPEIVKRLNLQARLNAWAAVATGLSGLFQAIALQLKP